MLSKEILWHFQECWISEKVSGCFSSMVLWIDKAMPCKLYSYQQMKTSPKKHFRSAPFLSSPKKEISCKQHPQGCASCLHSLWCSGFLNGPGRGWFGRSISGVGLLSKQGVCIIIKKIWWAGHFPPLCMNLISMEKDDFHFPYISRKFKPTTTLGESKLQSHFTQPRRSPACLLERGHHYQKQSALVPWRQWWWLSLTPPCRYQDIMLLVTLIHMGLKKRPL